MCINRSPGGFTASSASINTTAIAGQYKVTVTGSAGCISTASKTVTVTAAPIATITGNINVCVNGTINLTASGGNSYNWSGPNGYTQIGNKVVRSGATVTMSGTYTVTVTGSGGCTATASVLVTVATCKNGEEISGLETLTAYPNPTNAVTTISFTTPEPDEVCLSVYAIDGREVAVLFKGSTEADVAIQVVFDTQDLPAGTYYAVLRRSAGTPKHFPIMIAK